MKGSRNGLTEGSRKRLVKGTDYLMEGSRNELIEGINYMGMEGSRNGKKEQIN